MTVSETAGVVAFMSSQFSVAVKGPAEGWSRAVGVSSDKRRAAGGSSETASRAVGGSGVGSILAVVGSTAERAALAFFGNFSTAAAAPPPASPSAAKF